MSTATSDNHPAPPVMTPRSEVFAAIDAEREFQNALAAAAHGDPTNDQKKGLEHFALYINHYALQLQTKLTTVWGPKAYEEPLHILRKIAALAVAAQETHGVRFRVHTDKEVARRVSAQAPFPAPVQIDHLDEYDELMSGQPGWMP